MISAYSPILKKYSPDSPEWYRRFHSVFYMSQLTNQILFSYLESKIEDDKKDMIDDMEVDLVNSKIIRKDSKSGAMIVSKPDALKSKHIESVIDAIVDDIFENNEQMTDVYLSAMGLIHEGAIKKDISIDRNSLLNSTTSKNWYELISGLLTVWEFIFLYGAVESAFKDILSKHGKVREEDLLGSIFDRFANLPSNLGFERGDFEKIWIFYTELRNIYVHNHGRINNRIKSNLGGKLNGLKEAICNMHAETIMIADLEEILKDGRVQDEKFYFMRDTELNIFRNSMIHLVENIEMSHLEILKNESAKGDL